MCIVPEKQLRHKRAGAQIADMLIKRLKHEGPLSHLPRQLRMDAEAGPSGRMGSLEAEFESTLADKLAEIDIDGPPRFADSFHVANCVVCQRNLFIT